MPCRMTCTIVAIALCISLAGCATTAAGSPPAQTMTDAVTAKPAPATKVPAPAGVKGQTGPVQPGAAAAGAPNPETAALATVNGRPIAYAAWLNLMKRAHGLSAFQQILAVELARQAAEAKGIMLTEPQLEAAFRQEQMDVAGPETKDPAEAERILRTVLARRGVSLDEFRLSAYRNAYLRQLAMPLVEPGITDDALKVEFDRIYGPKVQVRHIQLSDSNAISTALQALDKGADFADLAKRISQNIDSAPEGGLLTPFSHLDPNVPAEIREAAFGLEPGKVSGPIRIDGWTQIVKLEKRVPAEPVDYAGVVNEVRRSLTEQLVRQKMQQLLRNMLQSASIQVYDGELGKQFQALREAK
jgi:parvulin-like peptidyl-prolyl isomerase